MTYLVALASLTLLTLLPGPDLAVVMRSTLASGPRCGYVTSVGVVVGLLGWGLLTVAGVSALLDASSLAYHVLRFGGAAYLGFLGIRLLWQSRRQPTASAGPTLPGAGHTGPGAGPTGPAAGPAVRGAFRAGLLTNLLNPKIAAFYSALLPSLVPAGGPHALWLAALVLTHVAVSLLWLAACVLMMSRSRGAMQGPSAQRLLHRVTGVVLVGFAARLAVRAG
ncbi:MAG TPA: LysE family translocator [Dermatophilaceae bacterium]|nr:LysE family translocator [Dermatophilaceae bacterium]